MRTLLLTVCIAALAPCALAADESYTIKLKRFPAVGKSITVRDSEKGIDRTKLTDAAGKALLDGTAREELREEEYTERTIEGGEPAPKKFTRFYRKARVNRGKGFVAEPREGKVVVFELKDGKVHTSVEGRKGKLPGLSWKELAMLARKAEGRVKDDLDTLVLPGRAVKVGEAWVIPAKKMASPAFSGIDPERSKVEGRLVKAYKKGGQQWGTVQFKASLVVNRFQHFQFDPPGSLTIESTIDGPIDGSGPVGRSQSKMTVAGKGTAERGGMRFTFEMNAQLESKLEVGD